MEGMTAHVVVPVAKCPAPHFCRDADVSDIGRCPACLGDGTRAVLDDAVPVERFPFNDETAPWREVPR